MTKCSLCGQSFDPEDGPCGCGFAKPKPTVAIRVSKLREWIDLLVLCVNHQGQGSINASRVIDELQLAIDGAR